MLKRATELEGAGRPRHGRTLTELLEESAHYRAATERALPEVMAELDGAAEGADVDPVLLFAASIEELWDSRPSQSERGGGRCTDVVLTGGATVAGTLVAHNNDLGAGSEGDLVAIERSVPGEPVVFTLGIGPWASVGWNGNGLSLTGNELSPNDERIGIPRLLLVRAQLRARNLEEAVAITLHPRRASAYNTVLADHTGAVVNLEASATAYACWGPSRDGTLVHTNHYLAEQMRRYEERDEDTCGSSDRFDRACFLASALARSGADGLGLRRLLSDHEGRTPICRHGGGEAVKTVFWCIAELSTGTVTYGRSNPCDSEPDSYRFMGWPGAA